MGIQSLLPQLKSIMDKKHVAEYAGQKVGIDAYAWLHRSSYTCAQELCLGQPSTKWLDWCLTRCKMLEHFRVLPVLVFDGGRLPEKDKTERTRREGRQASRARAMEMLAAGDRSGAFKMFQKAVDITPAIARTLMTELRKRGVEFINAPYEADAQLAYLSLTGYIAAVISEDSDMLAFGCARVLFKMDKDGHGEEVRLKNLGAVTDLSFAGWTHDMFQQMCVLAGCDYLESLPNVGIKKAHAAIAQNRSWDRAIRRIRLDGKTVVPREYERDFELALLTFKHQRVYDPIAKKLVHLTPVSEDFTEKFPDSAFLGADMPEDVAQGIAEGRYDPDTKQPFAAIVAPPPHPPAIPAAAAAAAAMFHTPRTPSISASAAVPSFAAVMSAPPRPVEAFIAPVALAGGWAKKHSTLDHHAQPAAAPAEFAIRHGRAHVPNHAHHAHAASSHLAAAASAAPPSLTQRRVLETCSGLFDPSSDATLAAAAAAALPAALRHDFRPPRKHDSLRDVTNTRASAHFASTQPNPKLPAWTSVRRADPSREGPPSTAPQQSQSHRVKQSRADRERALEQAASGASRYFSASWARNNNAGGQQQQQQQEYEPIEIDDDAAEEQAATGFTYEDVAAEMDMEQQLEHAHDIEESKSHDFLPVPPRRRPKMNFLSRSAALPPRVAPTIQSVAAAAFAFAADPPTEAQVRPRTKLTVPSAVPLAFESPPEQLTPSPPPPAPAASRHPLSSKYFVPSKRSTAAAQHAAPHFPAAPPRAVAVAAATAAAARDLVPDASAFLFAPASVPTPATFASMLVDEPEEMEEDQAQQEYNEGRIEMDDVPGENDDEEEDDPSWHRRGANGAVKRSAGASAAASALKRFKSPMVNSKARMTLQVTKYDALPASDLAEGNLFQPVRMPTTSRMRLSDERDADDAESPRFLMEEEPISPAADVGVSPDPIVAALARSQAAAQPFKHLTVQPRSPRAAAAAAASYLAPPTRTRYFDSIDLCYSSQPADATPPSPTPSPSPSPLGVSGSASVSPSPPPPPPVSQPWAAVATPYAAAGFSSQPSDDEAEEDAFPRPASEEMDEGEIDSNEAQYAGSMHLSPVPIDAPAILAHHQPIMA